MEIVTNRDGLTLKTVANARLQSRRLVIIPAAVGCKPCQTAMLYSRAN
jgi:hypothetical protein